MSDTFDPNATPSDPQNDAPIQQDQSAQQVDAQPEQTQPVEAQPVEAQPVEAQPVEAQPVEAQPVPQPGYQQPGQPLTQQPVGDTAPLVLGILSIIFAGIIGLVLSIIGMSKSKQVLEVMPDSGKAKAGRICSIIGLVASIAAFVVVIAMTILGIGVLGVFGGEAMAVDKAANQTLESITNPSSSEKDEIAMYFETAFESASGLSLSKLGINKGDFSNWLFEGTSYKITNTRIESNNNTDTATITAEVTAHNFQDLSTTIDAKTNSPSITGKLNGATTEAEVYSLIGQIIKEAMADTQASTKTVTFKLVKNNGTWTADDSSIKKLAYDIYAS